MPFYVICGKPDCIHFAHATYVAQYLYERLPNFKYKKIEKSKTEWPDFVAKLNKKFKWFMVNSPIIWKEISTWGGKPYLIGGLGQFWEHCYCYYGLESLIQKEDLQKLACDNMKFFEEEREKLLTQGKSFHMVVSIFGATNYMTIFLIEELFKIPEFSKENGIFIKLHEEGIKTDSNRQKERINLESIVKEYNSYYIFGNRDVIKIVKNEVEAVEACDLLIFIEDFTQKESEQRAHCLSRCITRMTSLADTINIYGKRSLRIIFANPGPLCFLATCMVEYCTVLNPTNIVAVTADQGLSVINTISDITKVPVEKITAPPVWGFIGLNQFVDEANIIFKAHILRPYARALTAPVGSTLPLGTVVQELRLMSYLVPDQHEEITKMVQEKNEKMADKLHRAPILSKLRALTSLIKIWFSSDQSDQIISLGVCSNGSFDIPPGIVFSQPVIQNEKRRWSPCHNFPLMNDNSKAEIKTLTESTVNILTDLGFDFVEHPLEFNVRSSSVFEELGISKSEII